MVFPAIKALFRLCFFHHRSPLERCILYPGKNCDSPSMGTQNGPTDGPSMGHGKKVGGPSMGMRWSIDGPWMGCPGIPTRATNLIPHPQLSGQVKLSLN